MEKLKVLNSKGQPVILNEQEDFNAKYWQKQLVERFGNALGYEVDITTLTTIVKKISEQKFFEVAPADYLPVRVGEGAFSSNLITYRSFAVADDFETGVINTGANNSKLASADAGVDSVPVKIINWAKTVGWNIMELQQAIKAGNWDLVSAKEESRKKNWDLGIQKIAFLGAKGDTSVKGLLNQSGIVENDTVITTNISAMDPGQLKVFMAAIIEQYRGNCARTAWPTHLIMPESDYLGLISPSSATFPISSTIELLEKAFSVITKKPFKILPLAYADAINSSGVLANNRYALLNYDDASIRMDIPVDYTSTLANSIDNFSFQNVAYGQFTGVQTYRPSELMYFKKPV